MMHWPGIEPGPPAWQARILPLNHQCYTLWKPLTYLHVLLQSQQTELMLEVNSQIEVLCRVNHHVDEVHASYLKVSGDVPMIHEVSHQALKPMSFVVLYLEVIHCLHDLSMASPHQAHCCQELCDGDNGSEGGWKGGREGGRKRTRGQKRHHDNHPQCLCSVQGLNEDIHSYMYNTSCQFMPWENTQSH